MNSFIVEILRGFGFFLDFILEAIIICFMWNKFFIVLYPVLPALSFEAVLVLVVIFETLLRFRVKLSYLNNLSTIKDSEDLFT